MVQYLDVDEKHFDVVKSFVDFIKHECDDLEALATCLVDATITYNRMQQNHPDECWFTNSPNDTLFYLSRLATALRRPKKSHSLTIKEDNVISFYQRQNRTSN